MSSINTKYLVFENNTTSLNMNKINVFANGSEMPWTYYQTDIVTNAQLNSPDDNDAKRRLMWTSESKASSSGIPAGKYVSEIKRKTKLGGSYIDEIVKNPTLTDFKKWGWPLKKDEQANELLPEYGEFAFRPGMSPSYEDASNITVTFKFGFGLNNTCYNFAEEQALISVYNLSSAPKFYLTDNAEIIPRYVVGEDNVGRWNDDMTEADENDCVTGSISEGINVDDNSNPFYKYLLIRVEAGEHIEVKRTGNALGNIKLKIGGHEKNGSQVTASRTLTDSDTGSDGVNNDVNILNAPYKMNVIGASDQVSPTGIKYDFYRVRLELATDNQTLAYLTNSTKNLNLSFTPTVYSQSLTSFKKSVNIKLDVIKKVLLPYIRDDLQLANHGFEDVKYDSTQIVEARDLSDQSNLRVRNIITVDEAIHYAVTNNAGLSFCRNKTFESALDTYKKSILTTTEKNLDEYKLSFNNEDKMKRFAYYIAIDMSDHVLENFKTFDASDNDDDTAGTDMSAAIDLSDLYNGGRGHLNFFRTELTGLRESVVNELTNKSKVITYESVLANAKCAQRLSALYRKMKETKVEASSSASDRGYDFWDASGLPYMDRRINEPRHFGEIVDVSQGHFMSSPGSRYNDPYSQERIRNSLMGQPSTLPTLMFALYEHKKGRASIVDKYKSQMNHDKGSTKIRQLVEAMRKEYNVNREKDLSGNSMTRPVGHSTELDDFRWELNPVNGELASKYLKKVMRIVDIKDGPDTVYYGADAARTAHNLDLIDPTSAEIKSLLYTGSVGKQTIEESNRLLSQGFASGARSFKISNPTLTNVTTTDNSTDNADRLLSTYDGLEFTVPTFGLKPYPRADQSSVFYSYSHRFGTLGEATPLENNKTYIGDCSGWMSSFIKKTSDKISGSNQLMAGQWVYTNDYASSGVSENRTGYTDITRHSENADFSGIIKFPRAQNGNYTDVYIGGQELRETMIDVAEESLLYNLYRAAAAKTIDMSGLPKYANDLIPQDVSDSRVNVSFPNNFKKVTTKINIVTVGGYQFYRIGSVIRVLASKDTIDADQGLDGGLPEITFKSRGDKTGICDKSYKVYVYPKDSSSNLHIQMNPKRLYGYGYDVSGAFETVRPGGSDTSGVWASRWTQSYMPIDVSGQLEKGEKFKIDILADKWHTSDTNFIAPSAQATTAELGMATYSADFPDEGFDIPADCQDLKYVIQYQNDGSSEWIDANGVEFEYNCDHKDAAGTYANVGNVANAAARYNTNGIEDDAKESKYGTIKRSSNVKGMPKFRAKIVSQAKLLDRYKSVSGTNSGSALSNFGSIGREAKIQLTYTHSIAKETFHQVAYVRTYVSSDAFSANIRTRELQYSAKDLEVTPGTIYKFDRASTSVLSLPGISGAPLSVVYYNTLKNVQGRGEQPDYTKMVANTTFRQEWYTLASGSTHRDISGMELKVPENVYGVNQPIAEIRFDNYVKNQAGEFGAQANIVPLFRKESDYREWEINGTYTNSTNSDGATGANANVSAPDLIPANPNYGISMSSNGTKAFLYRKTPFNYEEWIGGTNDLFSKNSFFDGTNAYRELVTVRVKYVVPTSEGITAETRTEDRTINFYVKPIDRVELDWASEFTINVDEGDASVDVTAILSAKMHNGEELVNNDDIKYFIAGFIDESGLIYMHHDGDTFFYSQTTSYTDLSGIFDASNIREFQDDKVHATLFDGTTADGGVTNLVLRSTSVNDIMHLDYQNIDLKEETVNGKLTFFHKNHATAPTQGSNTRFDAYDRKSYKILIGAMFDQNDQSGVERKLALLNIQVREASTGFYIKDDTKPVVKVVETLGTLAEGKSAALNNPEIKLQDLLDKIAHEDLTPGEMYDKTKTKYSVTCIDPALEVCPPSNSVVEDLNFENQVIKLRDIDTNKTTETKMGGAYNIATHSHYNYERQKSYQVHICAELRTFTEIEVVKASNTYVCGLSTSAGDGIEGNVRPNNNAKTAEYIMTAQTVTGVAQVDPKTDTVNRDQGRRYYFKEPSTGKYHGPLSLTPETFEDLTQTKTINGVKVKNAYVRFASKTGAASIDNFTPLYKSINFEISDKAPKPQDNCLQIFTINVVNTFDKEKTSPQPYKLESRVNYESGDPANQLLLDNTDIEVKTGSKHVCYVYGDHNELNTNNRKDNANDAVIPLWHPHHLSAGHKDYLTGYKSGYAKNKLGNGITRKVHPLATKETENNNPSAKNPNGHANNSLRYGKFMEVDNKDGVFLDFFVEHHGTIDASGWNEIEDEHIFGQVVDYSGSQKSYKYSTPDNGRTITEKAGSDKRLYSLNKVRRHRQHLGVDLSDSYFTTGELKFTGGKAAEEGATYNFTVVGVTNKLATNHDLSYNKNMVDWNSFRYPKLKGLVTRTDGNSDNEKVALPQPFQKYVYDPSGERVVTYGYAVNNLGEVKTGGSTDLKNLGLNFGAGDGSVDSSGTLGAIIRPIYDTGTNTLKKDHTYTDTKAIPNADSSGALFCCRTHFTVIVGKTGSVISSSANNHNETEVTGKMVFNTSTIVKASLSNGVYTPYTQVTATPGQIMIFEVNGSRAMVYYNEQTKEWRAI